MRNGPIAGDDRLTLPNTDLEPETKNARIGPNLFGSTRRVNEATDEFSRVSGINSRAQAESQIQSISRTYGVSSSEVIVLGLDFMKSLDREAHGGTYSEASVQAAIDATSNRLASGQLRFLGKKNVPIAATLQPHQAGAIVREVARKYRPRAFEVYYEGE